MLSSLKAIKTTLDKKRSALIENIELDDFSDSLSGISVINEPFPHVVINNCFKPNVYSDIQESFMQCMREGLSEKPDSSRFSPFLELQQRGFEYDGYKFVPRPEDNSSLSIFYSVAWSLFFSDLFKQPTGWTTSLAFHHHPAGDRTGFVHHDYAMRYFSLRNRLSNGMIYREQRNNSADQTIFGHMRSIALLFYLGNEEWKEGDGGGTGLYANKGTAPVKIIEPVNNRLLAFQISPRSFHAFQTNRTSRASIVQWFHTEPEWCIKRYGHL